MDAQDIEKLIKLLRTGMPLEIAAQMCGVTLQELYELQQDNAYLRKMVMVTTAEGRGRLFLDALKQSRKGNISATKFLLERTMPEQFGPPKQVMETRRLSISMTGKLNAPEQTHQLDLAKMSADEIAFLQELQQRAAYQPPVLTVDGELEP